MSTPTDEETTTPWGQLCDIVRYAPIGVLLDGPSMLPQLAEQGKTHVRNAQVLGKLAVREAEARLRPQLESLAPRAVDLLRMLGVVPSDTEAEPAPPGEAAAAAKRGQAATATGTATATEDVPTATAMAPGADVEIEPDEPVPAAEPSGPTADELAIPDYDSLSASQVVNRLPGLAADELEAVRRYEAAHRGRKTILNKVAQLQASA
jgi:hypothetical protein